MIRLVVWPVVAVTIRKLPPDLKRAVREAIRAIAADPLCGEPLQRELVGYRKYRVRRFRIVYRVNRPRGTARIVAVGPRTTIYEELADRLRGGE